ncbi:MAG: uroporphyrinogen-III synthase [Sedimenticolaceae bacterium]
MASIRPAAPRNLDGLSVLVTRPVHQADKLCALIEAAHGRPIRFPALEILGPADKVATRAALAAARWCDLLIFVSTNAVDYAFPLMPDQLPVDVGIAAVGQATAQALDKVGLAPTLVPERMDSEGLLALPGLQHVQGKSVLILRGNGGREHLADALLERGAEVVQVEVYRRQTPKRKAAAANLVQNWEQLVDVVSASSNAILDNLFAMLGETGASLLRRTPLVVVSQRMAAHAVECGCEIVHVANSARDEDVLVALCALSQDIA